MVKEGFPEEWENPKKDGDVEAPPAVRETYSQEQGVEQDNESQQVRSGGEIGQTEINQTIAGANGTIEDVKIEGPLSVVMKGYSDEIEPVNKHSGRRRNRRGAKKCSKETSDENEAKFGELDDLPEHEVKQAVMGELEDEGFLTPESGYSARLTPPRPASRASECCSCSRSSAASASSKLMCRTTGVTRRCCADGCSSALAAVLCGSSTTRTLGRSVLGRKVGESAGLGRSVSV